MHKRKASEFPKVRYRASTLIRKTLSDSRNNIDDSTPSIRAFPSASVFRVTPAHSAKVRNDSTFQEFLPEWFNGANPVIPDYLSVRSGSYWTRVLFSSREKLPTFHQIVKRDGKYDVRKYIIRNYKRSLARQIPESGKIAHYYSRQSVGDFEKSSLSDLRSVASKRRIYWYFFPKFGQIFHARKSKKKCLYRRINLARDPFLQKEERKKKINRPWKQSKNFIEFIARAVNSIIISFFERETNSHRIGKHEIVRSDIKRINFRDNWNTKNDNSGK